MDSEKDRKRKKEKHRDEDKISREKKSKNRSRSRTPDESAEKQSRRKRRHSRSPLHDEPPKQERYWDNGPKAPEVKDEPPERKKKETDMLNTRTGGAYIPPARLRMMQAQITDKSSAPYQRLSWEALKKSIHGHINKINVGNIGIIIKELLRENIVRGRGLLCRSIIQAQAASPTFTNVYAALVAAVNSRFPNIGELLLKRLVIQFKRGFKRNDKPICISSASFIAHLVNQRVAHEILALELLTLLVETPTDDSVEVSIAFLKECGQKLTEVSSKGVNAIFEMLRNILHEGQLDKRVQYMIEVMFQVWKDGFKDHPALIEELELVPEEDQFTHLLMLDDATDPQDILNVFKLDEKYEENEQKYKNLCKEILGSDAESGEEHGSGSESGSEEDDEEAEEDEEKKVTIIDNTETNLVALRRTIYLTINSSLDFEECAHKLLKMQLKPGQEVELCHMFLDCCAEQRTYEKFYGLLAQRFCNINRIYIGPFEEIFKDSYGTAHRLDTNRLRNVSKFFAHLFFTDSISWEALDCVKLNEEDTTSSSRIYIKILFQELAEYMGLKKLNDRLKDPTLQDAFSGIFPRDNPKNTRFSINFFTSIGLGGLTDELREHLKQMPKNVLPANTEIKVTSDTDSDSSSSSSSDSSSPSSSESNEEADKSKKKKKKDKSKLKKDDSPKTMRADVEQDKNKADKGERWGHDGFYDTYGKDARRMEPPRVERDKDNFVIPRNPRDRGDRPRRDDDRRRDRNEDDRRDVDRRRDRNDDDRRDDDRRRDRNEDDRRDVDRRRDRNDDDRRDDDKRRDRNGDEKRVDDRRRDRNEDDRKNEDRRRDRSEDDRRDERRRDEGRRDTDRDRNEDNKKDEKRTRDQDRRDVDRDRNEDNRKDRENGERRTRDEDPRSKDSDRERDSGYESRNRSRNEDREDDRRNRDKRAEYESRRKDKIDDSDNEYKDKRDQDGDARETRHDDERRSKEKRSTDELKSRRDRSDDEKVKDDEYRLDKRKKDERNDRSKSSKHRDSSDDEKKSSKKRRDKAEQSSDSEEDTKSKDKRNESSKSSKHRDSSDNEKKSSKKRREKAEQSSDDEEETKSRKRDKKKKKKKSKEEKENSWDIKSKRAVERQSKNTKVGSYYKNEVHSEDWDIQRESSIAPDQPGGRYWPVEGGERGTPEKV